MNTKNARRRMVPVNYFNGPRYDSRSGLPNDGWACTDVGRGQDATVFTYHSHDGKDA